LSLLIVFLGFIACKAEKKEEVQSKISNDPNLMSLNDFIIKNPGNSEAYFNRAKYFYDLKAYDEAIVDLASAMKIDSMKPKYYHLLADTYMDYYQSRMALMTMQKASGMFPDSIHTLLKLTEYEIILQKYDAAMQTIRSILEKDKQNADAYLLMGTVLEESGDNKRALAAFKKSTEMNPFLIDAWIKAGEVADKMGEKDAKKYFETAIRIDTSNYSALYATAMHYQNKNDRPEAIKWLKKINLIHPNIPDPYLNIGILYNEMDSLQKALEFVDIAINLDKVYSNAYFVKGTILERQGNLKEAQKNYSQASTLNPKFTKAMEESERLRKQLEAVKK
jgi:tetratricopeptide (TPR) repeat protein